MQHIRSLAVRRRKTRNALTGLLLAIVVSVEALAMAAVYTQLSRVPVQRQPTIDPAVCFQGR